MVLRIALFDYSHMMCGNADGQRADMRVRLPMPGPRVIFQELDPFPKTFRAR
jgi:hypothetical protein